MQYSASALKLIFCSIATNMAILVLRVFINWFIHDMHGEVYDDFHENCEFIRNLADMLEGVQDAPDSALIIDLRRLCKYIHDGHVFKKLHMSETSLDVKRQTTKILIQIINTTHEYASKLRDCYFVSRNGVIEEMLICKKRNVCECCYIDDSHDPILVRGTAYVHRGMLYPKSIIVWSCEDIVYGQSYNISYKPSDMTYHVEYGGHSLILAPKRACFEVIATAVLKMDINEMKKGYWYANYTVNKDLITLRGKNIFVNVTKHLEKGNLPIVDQEDVVIVRD